MPPLWQYFLRLRKRQTSPSLPPKGANRGPPDLFPCKPGFSRDRGKGPSSPFLDPLAFAFLARCRADAELAAKVMAPVVAVLRHDGDQPDEPIPAPKGRESRTPTDFPLHNSLF
jgi:hypothetical protein